MNKMKCVLNVLVPGTLKALIGQKQCLYRSGLLFGRSELSTPGQEQNRKPLWDCCNTAQSGSLALWWVYLASTTDFMSVQPLFLVVVLVGGIVMPVMVVVGVVVVVVEAGGGDTDCGGGGGVGGGGSGGSS